MKHTTRTCLAICLALTIWQVIASDANAQFGTDRINRPFGRPTVSPYVNMLRGGYGVSAAANYYGSVRPQQQFYAQNNLLTNGLNRVQMQQNQSRHDEGRNDQSFARKYRMGITGHPASFMSFGGGSGTGGSSVGTDLGGQNSTGALSGHSVGFGSTNGSTSGF